MRNTSIAAERGRKFCRNIVIPFIEFAAGVGGQLFFWTGDVARYRVHGALGVGVSPASNLTTNLPQSVVTSYDKVFVENLKAETPWVRCTARRTLDENSGNKLQLFMYQNLPAPPTTQAPEGTIGTGLTVSVVSNTSTIGNYADYANISTYALQTALDPALEALGVQMAYRMAQVINIIIQNTVDGASVVDATVVHVPIGTGLIAQDITSMVQSLAAVNALPFDQGRFTGVIHPLIVGDILISTQPNGITDVLKRTAEGQEKLRELPSPDGDEVAVIDWGGASFHQSTLVKLTVGTPNKLRTYVIGKDGIIGISFGAKENTQIGDGDWRNLNVWVRRLTEPSGYDPSRMIGGFASYNTMYTCTLPPDPVQRVRYTDAQSVIT
jgi:hypothetical protein